MNPEQQVCRSLPAFLPDDWDDVTAAFAGAASAQMYQGWSSEPPPPNFRPATVRFGLSDGNLWTFADLADDDVYNDTPGDNQADYLMGDIFEIFLRPAAQPAYFEFHVAPGNQFFQLRLPRENCLQGIKHDEGIEALADLVIKERIITSHTRLTPKGWQVLAAIPLARLVETGSAPAPGDVWHYSFCRYDCTRGQAEPVYSSTSRHKRINYHDQEGWNRFSLWS